MAALSRRTAGNALPEGGDEVAAYSFRLYTAGRSVRSLAAELNLRLLGDTRLGGDYELEVIDLGERPELAADEHIIATPTVIRLAPGLPVRVIGDLSELDRAAAYLGFPDSPAVRKGEDDDATRSD